MIEESETALCKFTVFCCKLRLYAAWSLIFVLSLVLRGGNAHALSILQNIPVSVNADANWGNSSSTNVAISNDGRFVVFQSWADNLVANDTNRKSDIFLKNLYSGDITRVSVSSDGTQADGASKNSAISGDGRYVVFKSAATNLLTGKTCSTWSIYIHDTATGKTEIVSVSSGGKHANAPSCNPTISVCGRYVAFESSATNLAANTLGKNHIYVHDRARGETRVVSVNSNGARANAASYNPEISGNGRFVVFESRATNLSPAVNTHRRHIYLHNLFTRTTTIVSQSSRFRPANNHSRNPAISEDGRFIVFQSLANNLVPNDTNSVDDIFIHEHSIGETTRISLNTDGEETNRPSLFPSISANGRYIAFYSSSTNIDPVLRNNRFAFPFSEYPDIFIHDRLSRKTRRISLAYDNTQANNRSWDPVVSSNSRFIAFQSLADNLVPGATAHNKWQVYVAELENTSQPQVRRIAGNDYIANAIRISQHLYPNPREAGAVVLARSDKFADALAGVPLAHSVNAPLLYTSSANERLDMRTLAEIERVLHPGGLVYILGGEGAISASIEMQLADRGYQTRRLGGIDRYHTAILIAQEVNRNPREVFLATGENFPDAISLSSIAARRGAPILLARYNRLPEHTMDYLEQNPQINYIYVAGGTRIISEDVFYKSGGTKRLGGSNRYATARIIAEEFFPPQTITVSSGLTFPDALSGALLAARKNAPILLTRSTGLSQELLRYLNRHHAYIQEVIIFGSPGSVNNSVLNDIRTILD